MALHSAGVGEHHMIELDRVRARCKIVDRVRSEVRPEHERVGAGAGVEDIIWSADQCRWAAAGGERLLPPASRMLRLRQERVLVRRRIDDECAAVAIA